jgi:hypothetical protein
MNLISQPLAVIAKNADVILMGELIDSKTTFYSYEYGKSSKAWDEISPTFSVKECLKGAWEDPSGSGTYYPPSFYEDESDGKEQMSTVIDGSGIEASLHPSETYLFFLETRYGANKIVRVEPETMREALQSLH